MLFVFTFFVSSSHFIVLVHLGCLDGASRSFLDTIPFVRCISPMRSVSRLSHPFHLSVPRNWEFVAAANLFECSCCIFAWYGLSLRYCCDLCVADWRALRPGPYPSSNKQKKIGPALNKRWHYVVFQLAVSLAYAFQWPTPGAVTKGILGAIAVPSNAADDELCQRGRQALPRALWEWWAVYLDQDGINWRNVALSSATKWMKIPPTVGGL